MEAVEEVTTTNDHVHIIKGKRTKRQRPSSPLAGFDITTSNSWSGEGGGGGDAAAAVGDPHSSQSPTTSAKYCETTEEEEDMANCLILLAQGHSLDQNSKQVDDGALIMEKFNSRRFNEGATTTTNKAGYYVYQCKTCSRCFSSFQALGGHRASHKKLKGMAEEKKTLMLLEDDSPSLNLQMGNKHSYTNNKSKIHECSVCGSEFTSGQALGGHMRRHRSSGTTANMNVSTAMDKILVATQDMNKEKNVLSLDLNLPAPEEERDSKFSFASKQHHHQQQQQPQPLVLSASSLVDCHY